MGRNSASFLLFSLSNFFFRKSNVGGLSNLGKQMCNNKKHKATTKKHAIKLLNAFIYLSFA